MSVVTAVLVNDVLRNLELDSAVSNADQIDKFLVYENLNAAQDDILRSFPLSTIPKAVKRTLGSLTNTEDQYDYETNNIRVLELFLSYSAAISDNNQGREAVLVKNGNFSTLSLDQRPTTLFPRFRLEDTKFAIRPVPTADQANGYLVKYIIRLTQMSSGVDCDLDQTLRNALAFRATQYCALVDGYDLALSAKFEELFNQQLVIFGGKNEDGLI